MHLCNIKLKKEHNYLLQMIRSTLNSIYPYDSIIVMVNYLSYDFTVKTCMKYI